MNGNDKRKTREKYSMSLPCVGINCRRWFG